MSSEKEISAVMKILKKQKFRQPIVTQVGERTRSPFQVLVSCLLSLRTRDETAAKASERLFAAARTPEQMMKLTAKQIEKLIYPVGFYKTKAKRIKEMSRILAEKYGGKVPSDFNELMKFKGVGRKTANIVMAYGFGKKDYIAIDTHCHRIPNRLGWIKTRIPEQTEEALKKLLPKRYWHDFNDLFVRFGQNICKPVKPLCYACPVEKYCIYSNKTPKPAKIQSRTAYKYNLSTYN